MSCLTFTLLLPLLLLSATHGDGASNGDVTPPLTYSTRVIKTLGQVCPLEHVTKMVRDEMSQDIRDQLRNSIVPVPCKTYQVESSPAASCTQIPTRCPSDYYWVSTPNGTAVQVYCDMDRTCGCNSTGGWTRIAYLNMTDPSQECPGAWVLRSQNSEPRVCGRGNSGAGCLSATYDTYGMNYSHVCGRVVGYAYASPDGFGQNNHRLSIDRNYVDGVSLTYGIPGSRQHIWSFAAGVTENLPFHAPTSMCPCAGRVADSLVPPYVGDDYFCESGNSGGWTTVLYADDPLWDGQGCGSASCCELSYPSGETAPWFCKQLTQATTDDIEVRICGNQGAGDEDTPVELVELYIH